MNTLKLKVITSTGPNSEISYKLENYRDTPSWDISSPGFHSDRLVEIKAMFGMLGGGENICGWLFIMELLPLGYHCIRKWQSLSQSDAGSCSWNTDCWTTWNTNGMLILFVVGEHEMWVSVTCYHLNCQCWWKILLILRNLNKSKA